MADDPLHVSDRDHATREPRPDRVPIDRLVLGVVAVFMSHSVHVVASQLLDDSVRFIDPATGRAWEVVVRPVSFPIDPRD